MCLDLLYLVMTWLVDIPWRIALYNGGRVDRSEGKGRLGGVGGCCHDVLYERRINLK